MNMSDTGRPIRCTRPRANEHLHHPRYDCQNLNKESYIRLIQ